jgi:hypothetical protein
VGPRLSPAWRLNRRYVMGHNTMSGIDVTHIIYPRQAREQQAREQYACLGINLMA